MQNSAKSLAAAARKLPPDQQAELIDDLVENLHRADPDWNVAWSAEADKRWAAHAASGQASHAAEDVLADISAHLAKKHRQS